MERSVYLAGPIAGLDYAGATDWRLDAAARLAEHRITAYSPMRWKEYLQRCAVFSQLGYDENPLSSESGIVGRDYNDVKRSDVILVNLLGADRVSIGTVQEMAWCKPLEKPFILVMEPPFSLPEGKSNPHEHAFIRQGFTYRTDSLDVGIELVIACLNPGPESYDPLSSTLLAITRTPHPIERHIEEGTVVR